MHIPVIQQHAEPLRTPGHSVELLHCAFDEVIEWNAPSLRNAFWRCYLPITEGASIRSSKKVWPMLKNEMIIIPPDCAVRGHADGPFTLYYAHFSCSLRLKRSLVFSARVKPLLRMALDEAVSLRSEAKLSLSLLQLVASALTSIPESNIGSPITDDRIDKAYRVMKENLDTRQSNADLALSLHMSEASLLRLFRQTVGASPQKEHLRLRLNHAAELLRATEESIEYIADQCGFWDRNHFTRVFTREWKTPPGKYRASAQAL